MKAFVVSVFAVLVLGSSTAIASHEDLIYGYECRLGKCIKTELSAQNFAKAISLPVCRMFCGDDLGTLWPKPSGQVNFKPHMRHIDRTRIDFQFPKGSKQSKLWDVNEKRFMDLLAAKIPNTDVVKGLGHNLTVVVAIDKKHEIPKLTLDTDESYKLRIFPGDKGAVSVKITADNFFGARHGLETLSQLIVYDDIRREVQILAEAEIEDGPVYKWRGLLLDTARNFYTVKAIKRTIDAMSMVKLNVFHWHITDSHSFPFQVKSQPELYKLGAYSPRKVYSQADISDVVEYGRARGVRVMPEFDAPAHVGEGWQHKNMTACFNAQPWVNFCVEPPCGQLDPTVDEMYSVLEDIYREMFNLFDPDVFHMGGDEVSVGCWNSSERIQTWMKAQPGWDLTEKSFIRLWSHFQTEALKRVDNVAKSEKTPIILWTSRLTDVPFIEYLDNMRYIIQIWTKGDDAVIQNVLERGFPIIVSNYDALYFDCGGAGWVDSGNNWCSPFIGWQKVYDNNLEKMAGKHHAQVLGSEAALWSEQNDEFTLDARMWPRASALAERLWTNPADSWRQAEARLLLHRQRLVENDIGAEAMQPEWCLQNENECPINAYK